MAISEFPCWMDMLPSVATEIGAHQCSTPPCAVSLCSVRQYFPLSEIDHSPGEIASWLIPLFRSCMNRTTVVPSGSLVQRTGVSMGDVYSIVEPTIRARRSSMDNSCDSLAIAALRGRLPRTTSASIRSLAPFMSTPMFSLPMTPRVHWPSVWTKLLVVSAVVYTPLGALDRPDFAC